MAKQQRVLITGGSTLLGTNIAAALMAEGADVTLLVRPGTEDRLGPLATRARWYTANIWDSASLRGRARGQNIVIHTVGSMIADPAQGLTHHRLNVISARNAANMCVSDGVPHIVLMSTVGAPWIHPQYVRAKREAESYVARVGLQSTIIRAPLVYMRGQPRSLFYQLLTLLGSIPPLSWVFFGRTAPMPLDILSRGVANITLDTQRNKRIYYAGDLRKRGKLKRSQQQELSASETPTKPPSHPFETLDEDTPFGWAPPDPNERPKR